MIIIQFLKTLQDPRREPVGVYDPAVEGFEDIQPSVPKEGASQESSSASANAQMKLILNRFKK
jgi:hypothetical protein